MIKSKCGEGLVLDGLKKWNRVLMLQLKDLWISQQIEPYIGVNTRELDRELYTGLSTLYTKTPWSVLTTSSLP